MYGTTRYLWHGKFQCKLPNVESVQNVKTLLANRDKNAVFFSIFIERNSKVRIEDSRFVSAR